MIAPSRRREVTDQVRGYCAHLGLDRVDTARAVRQAAVLMENGNTPTFAQRSAFELAERIRDAHAGKRSTPGTTPYPTGPVAA